HESRESGRNNCQQQLLSFSSLPMAPLAEQAAYKRKLQAYQEGQQRQAQLVQKLQAKVELEQESQPEEESTNELENALIRLEEEQQRSCSLVQVNSMLREQLEQANVANAALSEDIRKLTADWARARGELEQREAQWRREEESFNTYFSNEHGRLLTLWRQAVAFRRHFSQLRAATERSVGQRGLGVGWQNMSSPLSYPIFHLQRPALSLLGTRLVELTAALQQLREEGGEKERAVQALTAQLQKMVSVHRCARVMHAADRGRSHASVQCMMCSIQQARCTPGVLQEASRAQEASGEEVQTLRAELELLHQTLQDITQVLSTPSALPTPSCLSFPSCSNDAVPVPCRQCWLMTTGPPRRLPGSIVAASHLLLLQPRWELCMVPCAGGTSSCRWVREAMADGHGDGWMDEG
uniref:Rootletin-like coiled-coil domain-containing protein n=1 Tax=Coturnix japonica TaxID=93934 RepID=A0A8C2U5N0_COTJA